MMIKEHKRLFPTTSMFSSLPTKKKKWSTSMFFQCLPSKK
jgi:hypothetical protein